jgi:16S rRNA (uracil1498-N3)-methyltransferase
LSVRVFVPLPLGEGLELALPPEAVRHVQVLRHQPGDVFTLFNGEGCDWPAEVLRMGRQEVVVRVGAPREVAHELPLAVTLAVVMPANDRMDFLVEKATELGVATLQPLMSERSVLRLSGERAEKKQAHWQAVAVAAAGQCGRSRVPQVAPVRSLEFWLASLPSAAPFEASPKPLGASSQGATPQDEVFQAPVPTSQLDQTPAPLHALAPEATPAQARWLLSPLAQAPLREGVWPSQALCVLSGPEGGLSAAEEALALRHGFVAQSLGPRILRADTAPLAVLACAALMRA